MLSPSLKTHRSLFLTATALLLISTSVASAGDAYKWSVQYIIDKSRTIFGRQQKVSPRSNRGLAISADGKYLYAGYHHSFNNSGEVRRLSIDTGDYDRATEALLPGVVAKALATDDKGRVYITDKASVVVYDAGLEQRQLRIPTMVCEGLTTTRERGQLVLYATDRQLGTLNRYVLKEAGAIVSAATLGGFDGSGVLKVPGAQDLCGVKVDAEGRIWVADQKGGKVFRLSPDGQEVKSVPVSSALDVAIDGKRVFVSRSRERVITVLDDEVNVLGTLNVPWEELELATPKNERDGALGQIVVLPGKGFFVTNEGGRTRGLRSTYGRIDDHSDFVGGRQYRDVFEDDNEPLLRATEVEAVP